MDIIFNRNGQETYRYSIDEDELKALEYEIDEFELWVINSIKQKKRKVIDRISKMAINDIITDEDKEDIVKEEKLKAKQLLGPIDKWPNRLKKKIIRKAKLISAKDRNAEFEARPNG